MTQKQFDQAIKEGWQDYLDQSMIDKENFPKTPADYNELLFKFISTEVLGRDETEPDHRIYNRLTRHSVVYNEVYQAGRYWYQTARSRDNYRRTFNINNATLIESFLPRQAERQMLPDLDKVGQLVAAKAKEIEARGEVDETSDIKLPDGKRVFKAKSHMVDYSQPEARVQALAQWLYRGYDPKTDDDSEAQYSANDGIFKLSTAPRVDDYDLMRRFRHYFLLRLWGYNDIGELSIPDRHPALAGADAMVIDWTKINPARETWGSDEFQAQIDRIYPPGQAGDNTHRYAIGPHVGINPGGVIELYADGHAS